MSKIQDMWSVDPAASKPHAVAIWRGRQLAQVHLGTPKTYCHKMYIEDQFAGRNGSSVIKLARASGHLVGLLEGRQQDTLDVTWVAPAAWKRGLGKKQKKLIEYGVHDLILKRLSPFEMDVYNEALSKTGNQETKQDLADAVGIGLYAVKRWRDV